MVAVVAAAKSKPANAGTRESNMARCRGRSRSRSRDI
jgi:hypothetical protein